MYDYQSSSRESQVREHVSPKFPLDALLETRQLNLDLEPLVAGAESFRVRLPNGRMMDVQMRAVCALRGEDMVPPRLVRPDIEEILLAILTLRQLIDDE